MEAARDRRGGRDRVGGRLGLTLVLVALAACGAGGGDPVDRAVRLLDDDGGFSTPLEAGESFAHAAELLLDAGRACRDTCPAVLQAAAYVQLVAVEVLDCRLPDVHDARLAVLGHVEAVRADPASDRALPPLPSC